MLFFFVFVLCISVSQVTSVGINTEWGLLMASISEDTGEETPLQVGFSSLCNLFSLDLKYLVFTQLMN